MKLTINFSDFTSVKIGTINNKFVLTLTKSNSSFYLPIPKSLCFQLNLNSIDILPVSYSDYPIFNVFKSTFNNIKTEYLFSCKKKLLLKGLGFRSTFNQIENVLTFKLGYSHTQDLKVPNYIKNIKLKKTTILLEATDKILLGNYMQKIFNLKKSDSYKGKGFSYKYNTKKLKQIKKK